MLVVLTETYCNKVNIQIIQRDDFIQIKQYKKVLNQKSHWRYRFRCEDNTKGCLGEKKTL